MTMIVMIITNNQIRLGSDYGSLKFAKDSVAVFTIALKLQPLKLNLVYQLTCVHVEPSTHMTKQTSGVTDIPQRSIKPQVLSAY